MTTRCRPTRWRDTKRPAGPVKFWRREDAAEGIYITADDAQMMPIVDAEGYGTTYLFVDGQVRYASTKSELASITAPPGFTP